MVSGAILGPRSHWQKKACSSPPPTRGLDFFWEESRPWRRLGRLEASMPGIEAGRAIKRGWASQYSLGEPVLIGRARTHWASHQTRLGEPVLRGRWASHSTTFTVANACACLALCLLGTSTSACSARLLKCLLGTASACSAHLQVPARHVYLLVPARHCACSHLPRCLLGTAPPREVLQDVRPTAA